MLLTPEERQRIYEEEKVRHEAQQQLAAQAGQETASAARQQTNSRQMRSCGGCFVLGLVLWAAVSLSNANRASDPMNNYNYQAAQAVYAATPPSTSSITPDYHASEQVSEEAEKRKIVVQKNYAFNVDGNYDYIRGSVKNNSTGTVRYWKATAEFLNKSGDIVDTAYTNSGETLLPGAAKRFEIMHSTEGKEKSVRVFVEEVQFDPDALPVPSPPENTVLHPPILGLDDLVTQMNTVEFKDAWLDGLDEPDLTRLRNVPYARHGYKFKDAALRQFFSKQSWYVPTGASENTAQKQFNQIERANIKAIQHHQDMLKNPGE